MPTRRPTWPGWLAGAAAGAVTGYALERRWLRSRLDVTRLGEPLGRLDGDVRQVAGPDGVQLAVESYGDPQAPTVVLAHGWCMSGRMWHEQVAALRDRYHLVTYDQPGHARSSPPDSGEYPVDLLGDGLDAVLAATPTDGPVVLVGHSMGGMTILNHARRHADRFADRVGSVVLLSTTAGAVAQDGKAGLPLAAVARAQRISDAVWDAVTPRSARYARLVYQASSDLSHLLTRLIALARGADPRHVDFTEQLFLDAEPHMMLMTARVLWRLDERAAAACLTCPTTVVCGTEDRVTPVGLSHELVAACPDARFLELPGIGHMTPLEAADAVNALMTRAVRVATRQAAA